MRTSENTYFECVEGHGWSRDSWFATVNFVLCYRELREILVLRTLVNKALAERQAS
jgi:hypothetical protein